MLAGAVTTREIQAMTGVSRSAIWWARHHPPPRPPLKGRACGPVTMFGDPPYPVGWPAESDAAVRVCLTYCPVQPECAAWALTQPAQPGVLGGMTRRQRAARAAEARILC